MGIAKGLPMRESDYSEELGASIYSCRILGEILSYDLLGFPSPIVIVNNDNLGFPSDVVLTVKLPLSIV